MARGWPGARAARLDEQAHEVALHPGLVALLELFARDAPGRHLRLLRRLEHPFLAPALDAIRELVRQELVQPVDDFLVAARDRDRLDGGAILGVHPLDRRQQVCEAESPEHELYLGTIIGCEGLWVLFGRSERVDLRLDDAFATFDRDVTVLPVRVQLYQRGRLPCPCLLVGRDHLLLVHHHTAREVRSWALCLGRAVRVGVVFPVLHHPPLRKQIGPSTLRLACLALLHALLLHPEREVGGLELGVDRVAVAAGLDFHVPDARGDVLGLGARGGECGLHGVVVSRADRCGRIFGCRPVAESPPASSVGAALGTGLRAPFGWATTTVMRIPNATTIRPPDHRCSWPVRSSWPFYISPPPCFPDFSVRVHVCPCVCVCGCVRGWMGGWGGSQRGWACDHLGAEVGAAGQAAGAWR